MPVRLSDLVSDTRDLAIKIAGETLNVTYRPSAYTPELEDATQGNFERNRSSGAAAAMLAGLLVEWDLVDDDGEVIEIEVESLRTVPAEVLFAILAEIIDDLQIGKETVKNSGARSSRRVRRASSLGGTR